MNQENIEFALNQIAEEINIAKGQNEYLINAMDAIADKLKECIKQGQSSNHNIEIVMDTDFLEGQFKSKMNEILTAVKSQTKETYYTKSYFLYPEGKGKDALIYLSIKVVSIIIIITLLLSGIVYISNKIESNSDDAKYRLTLQYIYATNDSKVREYIKSTYQGVKNDSIKNLYEEKIKECPVKLK